MATSALTESELEAAAGALPGWAVGDGVLAKTFSFKTYLAGVDFVNRLAHAAEEMNHHPDLIVGWRKVGVTLCTHSVKAITQLDLDLARRAEVLFGAVAG